MRISDWSSDVCSSDLLRDRPVTIETLSAVSLDKLPAAEAATWLDRELVTDSPTPLRDAGFGREVSATQAVRRQRSEEHKSELQSLMRNSYDGFCLKKNQDTKQQQSYEHPLITHH